MNFFKKIINRIYPRQIERYKSDDFFIVSYPKSGNTWMRFVLGNYFFKSQLDFKSINEIMPDLHFNPSALTHLDIKPRIIKSHTLESDFNHSIYIVRDGRDAAVSYFYHLKRTKEIPVEMNFDTFLSEYFYSSEKPYGDWGKHVRKCFELKKEGKDIILIKYEDMLVDTFKEVEKVLRWMNVKLDEKLLREAINQSSFESLKDIEKSNEEYIYNERKLLKLSYGFIRKGVSGDWQNHFTDLQNKQFIERFGAEMKLLGYES